MTALIVTMARLNVALLPKDTPLTVMKATLVIAVCSVTFATTFPDTSATPLAQRDLPLVH